MTRTLLLTATLLAWTAFPMLAASDESGDDEWRGDLTPISEADWSSERAAHLLERAGFGGTPDEIARLAAMSPRQAVDYLVDYEPIDTSHLPPFDESDIYPNGYKYEHITKVAGEALATGMAYGVKATQDGALPQQPGVTEYYTLMWSDFLEIARAAQWWAERMVITPRPFQERMTLFWHDHFATSQEKVHRHRMMLDQIDVFRAHANGNFGELLVKIAQDPAMLIWLDNKDNVKGSPNENFAREIMELFTMGEGRGYTEADIREVARAFTGWTLTEDKTTEPGQGEFIDDPSLHDEGEKTFLGETGRFNGYDAVRIILEQPESAAYLAEKIYRYFVSETPEAETLTALAATLREGNYEVRPLMKKIFLSRDFYSRHAVGTQIKSPVQLIVSTYRKLGLSEVPGIPDFDETTAALNQSLLMPPNVAGWAGGKTWINPATLLARGNFVSALLFPSDPEDTEPPDKDIHEGYRHIPLKYSEYGIVPHIWNRRTGRMEPVSLAVYDLYLAGLNFNDAMEMMRSGAEMMSDQDMATKLQAQKTETKSALGKASRAEQYNLAVGIYNGHVEANQRVKAIPRTVAAIDMTSMLRKAEVKTSAQAVSYLTKRFFSVDLSPARRAAIERFANNKLGEQIDFDDEGTEQALREVLHLLLSAPEYQLA